MDLLSNFYSHRAQLTSNLQLNITKEFSNYQALELKQQEGTGFIDLADFSRMHIARSIFTLNHPKTIHRHLPLHFFGVNIFLSGHHQIHFQQLQYNYSINPPCILLRKGYLQDIHIELPEHLPITILSLDFNPDILKNLIPDITNHHWLSFFQNEEQIQTLCTITPEVLQRALTLVSLPICENSLDIMQLESKALALLSQLLQKLEAPKLISASSQLAIDNIRNHVGRKLTIPKLARLIGTNECDLKRQFKQETGMTIGQYQKQESMNHAITLLTQGQSLHYISEYLGYSSVYYFISVFKRHFGHPPVEIKKQY